MRRMHCNMVCGFRFSTTGSRCETTKSKTTIILLHRDPIWESKVFIRAEILFGVHCFVTIILDV